MNGTGKSIVEDLMEMMASSQAARGRSSPLRIGLRVRSVSVPAAPLESGRYRHGFDPSPAKDIVRIAHDDLVDPATRSMSSPIRHRCAGRSLRVRARAPR